MLKLRTVSLLSLLLCITCFSAYSQKPLRVEVEAKKNSDSYKVVPSGEDGVLLFYETDEKTKQGQKTWSFEMYDNNFVPLFDKEVLVEKGLEYKAHDLDEGKIYVLLHEEAAKSSYKILKIDPKKRTVDSYSGIVEKQTKFHDFKVIKDHVLMGGLTTMTNGGKWARTCLIYCTCFVGYFLGAADYKADPVLLFRNLSTTTTQKIELPYKGSGSVVDIHKNPHDDKFEIVIQNSPEKGVLNLEIKELNARGKETGRYAVKPGNDNILLNGRVSNVTKEVQLVMGTYSRPTGKKRRVSANINEYGVSYGTSQGLYFSSVVKGKQKFIKYHSFTEFKEFWSYLGPKTEQRVQKKIDKKESKDKELGLNYNLLIHDIEIKGDEYIMLAEAFYPEYHTESTTTCDQNGCRTTTRRVFDGWRYTHAIIAAFDEKGNLKWDHCFPIWDILTFNLKERVKMVHKDDKTVLIYGHRGAVESKVIKGDQIVEELKITEIPGFNDDKIRSSSISDIDYWYDNFLIVYGYQKIKSEDKDRDGKRKRTVFHFNKIAFE